MVMHGDLPSDLLNDGPYLLMISMNVEQLHFLFSCFCKVLFVGLSLSFSSPQRAPQRYLYVVCVTYVCMYGYM